MVSVDLTNDKPIQSDVISGKLCLGRNNVLTVGDILNYQKKGCLGRFFAYILFIITGKGCYSYHAVKTLLDKPENKEILEKHPNLKTIFKVHDVGTKAIEDGNKADKPAEIKDPEVEKKKEEKKLITAAWKELTKKTEDLIFEEVPQGENNISNQQGVCSRFANILPPKNTVLQVTSFDKPEEKHYFNANFVKVSEEIGSRKFIATQAPYDFGNELRNFWKVVLDQEKSAIILDLTNETDTGKGVTPYYPIVKDESITYGDMTIKLEDIDDNLFKYELKDNSGNIKKVNRFHFNTWKDGGIIEVKELAALVDRLDEEFKDNMPIVHCRAGVGRTGVVITASFIKEKIKQGKITDQNFRDSILNLILELRNQRGKEFVQTETQFKLLINYTKSLLNIN